MSRPNLVFVFADQMRQMSIGCMNADPVATPNLDRFAAESRNLTQACSNYPVCGPYRGILLTGKYPIGNQLLENPTSARAHLGRCFLREEERCIPDVLNEAGYTMGYIGKWHLDLANPADEPYLDARDEQGVLWDAYTPPGPRRHGFSFWHSYGCCNRHLTPHYWVNEARVHERLDVNQWSPEHETDVAIEFIENLDGKQRDREKPFGLFVSYNPPHNPYDWVPDKYVAPYAEKPKESLLNRPNVHLDSDRHKAYRSVDKYCAAVSGIDEQFGRILDCLSRSRLDKNTIVIFTSDHGEMMGSHGLMTKGVWYDESFLVPFLIRWPGRIQPGEDRVLLNTADIFPTLLSLLGESGRRPDDVEGMDLAPHLLGTAGSEIPSFQPYYHISTAHPELGRRGFRTERHTYVESRNDGEPAVILHDRQRDPYQERNAATDAPEVCGQLHQQLVNWLERTRDPWLTVESSLPAGDPHEQLTQWLQRAQQMWSR